MRRTRCCGAFGREDIGTHATACGWVQARRDMGGVIFIDLKDREGILQVVCDRTEMPAAQFHAAESLRSQSVIEVTGSVFKRGEETYNAKLKTGEVELRAEGLVLLSMAKPLPFPVEDGPLGREELRLKYRYLDIRRPQMLENLRFRHRLQAAAQRYLDDQGFIAIETPILTQSTPEGARDYLVPSRVHPGSFYALPQSPQIFKQLLMVGGVDRYYQVARCFRDEDLRADRQPEFTQVDMEMSFVTQEDILEHLESMLRAVYQEVMGREIEAPFARIPWAEAMDRYGSDKPDLRFDLPIIDLSEGMRDCVFSVFLTALEEGGVVRAINAKHCGDYARSAIEELTENALSLGAKGMAWIALHSDGSVSSILPKYFTTEQWADLLRKMGAEAGDLILFCADRLDTVRRVLGGLRLKLADRLGLRTDGVHRFLFVTDFPQFEYSEQEGRYLAMHHPFTMPYEEDLPYLLKDPARVRAQAYDVVLNGVELGSGSIRIHRSDVQQSMFEALGFSRDEAQARFGFFLEAFRYGTPPHGGFAFGLDRLAMLLCGADSLREVTAFPKLRDASCPMTGAPGLVEEEQLKALALGAASEGPARKKSPPPSSWIDIERVARLARLELTEAELRDMPGQLAAMIEFAGAMSAMDTDGIEPKAHGNGIFNRYRPDEPGSSLSAREVLNNAPSVYAQYLRAPRAFE